MFHYTKDYTQVNNSLKKTKKIIVSIGCSFTAGDAAFDDNLMKEFPPKHYQGAWTLDHYKDSDKKIICEKWPEIVDPNGAWNFTYMYLDNSFMTQLDRYYLKGSHTILNLGITSSGLHSQVMQVLLAPVDWSQADEIILIFCPTSFNRLSILVDDPSNFSYKTAWLGSSSYDNKSWNKIQEGFLEVVYSERWGVLNFLTAFQILNTWCKLNKVRLIVFPAFDNFYTSKYFSNILHQRYVRNLKSQNLIEVKDIGIMEKNEKWVFDQIPWNNFVSFQDKNNFYDLAFSQEKSYDPLKRHDSAFFTTRASPEKWIMDCGHPSTKAHRLLADELYKYFIKTDFCKYGINN